MIRIRLTKKIVSLVPEKMRREFDANGLFDSAFDFHPEALYGDVFDFKALADFFSTRALELEGVKGKGTEKRIMLAAIERIDSALAKANAIENGPVPVSITVEEQDALLAIQQGELGKVTPTVRDKLVRRGLLVDRAELATHPRWFADQILRGGIDPFTFRGRAILEGTPPGDLVPEGFLRPGVVVRFLGDRDDIEHGTDLEIRKATRGTYALATSDGAVVEVGPRSFLVVGRKR